MTRGDALVQLATAINERASSLRDDDEDVSQALADGKDLARGLARILSGETIRQALGSPGDWGYSTKIGQALVVAYAQGCADVKLSIPDGVTR